MYWSQLEQCEYSAAEIIADNLPYEVLGIAECDMCDEDGIVFDGWDKCKHGEE